MAFPLLAILAALGKGVAAVGAGAAKGIGAAAVGAGKTALGGIAHGAGHVAGAGGNILQGAGRAIQGGSKALAKIGQTPAGADLPAKNAVATGAQAGRGSALSQIPSQSPAGANIPMKELAQIGMPSGGGNQEAAGSSMLSRSAGVNTGGDPREERSAALAATAKRGGALAGIGRGIAGVGKGIQGVMEWYRDTPTPFDIIPPMADMKRTMQGTQASVIGRDFTVLKELQPGSKPWFDQFGQMAKQYGMNGIKQFMAQPQGQREEQFSGPLEQAQINYYNQGRGRGSGQDMQRATALMDRFDPGSPEYEEGKRLLIGQTGAPAQVQMPDKSASNWKTGEAINELGMRTGQIRPEFPGNTMPTGGPARMTGPGSALSGIPVAKPNPKIPWLRSDAPPVLATKVQKALDAGLSMEEIMQAADVQPYLMR